MESITADEKAASQQELTQNISVWCVGILDLKSWQRWKKIIGRKHGSWSYVDILWGDYPLNPIGQNELGYTVNQQLGDLKDQYLATNVCVHPLK